MAILLKIIISYGPFYSVEKATGIIIGVGNIGKTLSIDSSLINTYMSNDGGKSWKEVFFFFYFNIEFLDC